MHGNIGRKGGLILFITLNLNLTSLIFWKVNFKKCTVVVYRKYITGECLQATHGHENKL